MIAQIRTYTINKGMMESWIKIFQDEIMPRVLDAGMEVKLSSVNEEDTKFIFNSHHYGPFNEKKL